MKLTTRFGEVRSPYLLLLCSEKYPNTATQILFGNQNSELQSLNPFMKLHKTKQAKTEVGLFFSFV